MKTFAYTYRNLSGALKRASLQAPDRADALRQIQAQGHVPVSVTEGKGASPRANVSWSPKWNKPVWVAALAAGLIAALVFWRLNGERPAFSSVPVPVQPSQAQTSKPASVNSKAPTSKVPVNVHADIPVADIPREKDKPQHKKISAPSIPSPGPAVEIEPPPPPRHSYKTATEGLLSMAMSIPPGEMIPPLPISKDLDDDFAKSLTNTIVIYDDDDEQTASTKENVAVAKNQLLKLVAEGRSVAEVLKEFERETNERAAVRSEAQKELATIYENGSPEEAKAYLEKINKAFNELGIEPISLPRQSK